MNKLLLAAVVFTFWIGSSAAEEQHATDAPTTAQTVDNVRRRDNGILHLTTNVLTGCKEKEWCYVGRR